MTPDGPDIVNHQWVQRFLSQERADKMEKDYGINLAVVYKESLKCKKERGDGGRDVDAKIIPYDGNIPTCFFNLDIVKGKFNVQGGDYVDLEPL